MRMANSGESRRGWATPDAVTPYASPEGMYFVVVAGRDSAALASRVASGSLLTDTDETEAKRNDRNARDVMRLDALLRERDGTINRQSAHVLHLESLVARA